MLVILSFLMDIVNEGRSSAEDLLRVGVRFYERGYTDGRNSEAKMQASIPSLVRLVDLAPIVAHIRARHKIDAIKECRRQTGAGLKESKEFCDRLQDFLMGCG